MRKKEKRKMMPYNRENGAKCTFPPENKKFWVASEIESKRMGNMAW